MARKKKTHRKHPHRGHPISKKTRAKISKKLKGHKTSKKTRAKISKALKGHKHPHKGHKISAATRAKISKALKGRKGKPHKVSAATRKKISAALKGKKHPHKGYHGHRHRKKRPVSPLAEVARRKRMARGRMLAGLNRGRGFSQRVSGESNLRIVGRLAGRRVATTANRVSNVTVLQMKLKRSVTTRRHGLRNRRLVLNALTLNRHRR